MIDNQDTIVAIATAPGEGGIGIVRISGSQAEKLLRTYFIPAASLQDFSSHYLYYGHLRHTDGEVIDEVMAVIMRAPRSYTREDVVEIHCHGGTVVLRQIVDLMVDGGARLARPGEFTLRAFLNGRIDLARAEAVIDVIRSRSESACRIALGQMQGLLSRRIHDFRDVVSDLLAEVEAGIDFPEEELEIGDRQRILATATTVIEQISGLLDSFDSGRVLREGLSILIYGKPNVGKSSLMNSLLGEARAIVSDVPGTTRDTVEENLVLNGLPLRLVDTAGVRQVNDPLEAEGVQRAQAKLAGADLVLLVVDGSREMDDDDRRALRSCDVRRTLLVINKQDLGLCLLPEDFSSLSSVSLSAQQGTGLDSLANAVSRFFLASNSSGVGHEAGILSDRRHREALLLARSALQRFCFSLDREEAFEFAALELREALHGFGEITGETTPDDILEKIFTRFCIGK